MTYKRIVAFGCSNTVGEYLPGWTAATFDNAWKTTLSDYAWPFVLARKMSISQVDNLAWGGLGNHEILHRILNTDFRPDDLVVVAWSFAGREILFHSNNVVSQTMWGPNGDKFYAAHDIEDLELKSMEYVHHAELYLKSLGITYAMAQIELWNFKTPHWRWYNPDDYIYFNQLDMALDQQHPGVESHRLLAEKMYARIVK